MSPSWGTLSVLGTLSVFCASGARAADSGGTDGAGPAGALIQVRGSDDSATLYGATSHGGASDQGSVFRISARGQERVVHSFAGGRGDGASPIGALTQGRDGALYGITAAGGACARPAVAQAISCGTLFRIDSAGVETVVHLFSGLAEPAGEVLQASDGSFYGAGPDQIYKIAADGTETVLHQFQGGRTDGVTPSSLVQARDGTLYGTTQGGGELNHGTVFAITPSGDERLLYSFRGGADGEFPTAPLIVGADGALYGTTTYGGLNLSSATICDRGCGTVFRLTLQGDESVLHAFRGGLFDGAHPASALVQTKNGDFFGTTSGGGSDYEIGAGTVFTISAGKERMLHAFRDESEAAFPSSLIMGADGTLYGTAGGGRSGRGVIFAISVRGKARTLYAFGSARSRR